MESDNDVFKEDKGSLTKKSNVRKMVHDLGGRVEPEFIIQLENKISELVKKSYERATLNGRTTLMFKDL